MSIAVSFILIPILIIIAALPIILGVYVYRDAKRRGMNGALWTLITLLMPTFIGFVVYLLVRGNYSDMKCPKCDGVVKEEYVVCPKCGVKLRPSCSNCATPVEPDWTVCPKCTQALSKYYDDVESPVRAKDRTIWKILLLIILIPLLLIVSLLLFRVSYSSTGATNSVSMPVDEYLEVMDNEDIEAWIDSCSDDIGTAYVLEYCVASNDETEVQYLIYVPKVKEEPSYSYGITSGMFGRTLEVEYDDINGGTGSSVLVITCIGEEEPDLEVYYDGELLTNEITISDIPVSMIEGDVGVQDGVMGAVENKVMIE